MEKARKIPGSAKSRREPVRWDKLPHQELWRRAQENMELGSPARASTDSLRSVLKRRLSLMDRQDHRRFIELECVRVVETLRVVRDTYRAFLEPRINGPLAEMYWVVCRFGVMEWAVVLLRSTATSYIVDSKLPEEVWDRFFGFKPPMQEMFGLDSTATKQPGGTISHDRAAKAIEALVTSQALERLAGGPFGREYQYRIARHSISLAMLMGRETFPDVLKRRLAAWDNSGPWMEGLATLCDVTQDEVLRQFAALSVDGRRAEAAIADLPEFEKIAYRHLATIDREVVHPTTKALWQALLRELDESNITPSSQLTGIAGDVLLSHQKRGLQIKTWAECYGVTTRITLEDGKGRTLRRETTHAIQNAAKKAEYRLKKVWGSIKARS